MHRKLYVPEKLIKTPDPLPRVAGGIAALDASLCISSSEEGGHNNKECSKSWSINHVIVVI